MNKQLFCHMFLVSVFVGGTANAAPYIGMQFSVGGTSLTPTTFAGVVPQANFNSNSNQSGSITNLNSAGGTPTGVGLSWTADNSFGTGTSSPGPNGAGDAQLLSGEDKTYGTATNVLSTYSLTHVPTGTYDLIIYTVNDAGGATEQTNITTGTSSVATTLYSIEQSAAQWNSNPVYVNGGSTTQAGATTGNYIEFIGVTPTAGVIDWDHFSDGGGNGTVAYNGFELIAVPEPSTMVALIGLCGIGLVCLVWRRHKAR